MPRIPNSKIEMPFLCTKENVNNNYRYGYLVEITTGARGAADGWVIRAGDAFFSSSFFVVLSSTPKTTAAI